MHWVSWDKLIDTKEEGGMGFRELEHFNTALLAKELWRLISQPNLLVSRVVKAKYIRGMADWKREPPKAASWV